MRILHTESSKGWGGQEMRILREAEGMRKRGHEIILVVQTGGGLVFKAKEKGFIVYEVSYKKALAPLIIYQIVRLIRNHQIDLVNTHSSLDAWIGGIAAKVSRTKVIRTRHLSTPIKGGLNSLLLYRLLADFVVTTSSSILNPIQLKARISPSRLCCIPTGIDPSTVRIEEEKVAQFRHSLRLAPEDILIGTACFVRSWKGILDLLKAAALLKKDPRIKWVVVGGGHVNDYRPKILEMGLQSQVTFTGHLESPYAAIQAMDIFVLLSTAHEGISQASLQAAYLKRPLITTSVGGLPEVCIHGETGIVVPPRHPEAVAKTVLELSNNPQLRNQMGEKAYQLVLKRFTLTHTLDAMELVYAKNSK